ncbi:MAG TPA: PLP-dependent aminotransferase family protein [Hyphomicrobiaceae bacterium]|nr:PLP-dependent aminotransferase family protein [Hyphomicrobiaceae bacterium]
MSGNDYIKLADALADDIAAGRLQPGDRLLPQRTFAYRNDIAVSTASRVYSELIRRGLAAGEVGRGTYILGSTPRHPMPPEIPEARIDLEFNFPILPEQSELMAPALAAASRPDVLSGTLQLVAPNGTAAARDVAAQFLSSAAWRPRDEGLFFTGNGRQAIASAVGAMVPVGGRLGVEALTYPVVKANARRLGVTLVPLAMDAAGLRPDAIEKAHREGALSAVYLQPLLHNPLGVSLSRGRRQDLVKMAEKLDLMLIEDGVYRFLCDDPPLTALAPDRCILVDSLSKRIAPGVATGFICAPVALRERIMTSIRSGGWSPAGFAFAVGQRLIVDGTADQIAALKHQDAAVRQQIVAQCLDGLEVHADHRSYHLWLKLPEPWRSETFVAAAARHSIGVTPSSAFTVGQGHAPNAVRLALASPSLERLREALTTLARLLRAGAESFDTTE